MTPAADHRHPIRSLPVWAALMVGLGLLPLWMGPGPALLAGCGALILIVALIASRLLEHRDLFAPTVMFPCAYSAYFLLGSFNVTTGHVPPRVLGVAMVGLIAYFGGVALARILVRDPLIRPRRHPGPLHWMDGTVMWRLDACVLACLAISLAAAALIILKVGGTPLANLGRRHGLSAYLFAFVELGWVAAVLWNLDQWHRLRRLHVGGLMILGAEAALLALLAYRTPLIAMVLVAALGYHYLVVPLRPRRIAVLMTALVLFAGAYGWWRLQHTTRYGGYRQYLDVAGVKWTPLEPVAPLAGTIREGSVVLALLMENIPAKYPHQGGAVTFSTVTTVLPGWQRGPREWIGIYARGLEHSTTPSILGFLYVDWGYPGIVLGMMLFGMLLAGLYHLMVSRPSPLTVWLWAYVSVALLLSIHTGFADFRHIVLTVFAVGLAWITNRYPLAWLGHAREVNR